MEQSIPKLEPKAACRNEYDVLQKVVLCSPEHMTIKDIINETQKHFEHDNINVSIAKKQHNHLIEALESQNIEVILLPVSSQFPEQVFTRDIGFTIGETVFISQMAAPVRQGEENVLTELLHKHNVPFTPIKNANIEGGDVIAAGDTVYVGISERTEDAAVDQLQQALPELTIVSVPMKKEFLHLDCVFNIISEKEALVYPPALRQKELDLLSARFDLIEVPDDEQFTLGTNVLSLGNNTILSLPQNHHVNQELAARGFHVIKVELSEIIKSGGSFRCCTMPLLRTE
ncbi:dimethylarginine dimethylaminohydrolase family protein [Bacillus atrophaeus]|uniref:dimethylarginine dimethylaminohydrolase family protein n=1 Tax=Bacillus atrophaeus TaxID=1452 RepID=UPI00227EDF87|nr:dimethylarginine dimethylaminohydrolase family protein [Bacillus atrophaeus]MCY8838186.1 dimethylarginine dimethylaminohydrolase family protein [Bacillus atrophaeus]MCY9108404.1 dimethylarginine dimethylaminohydrolase family protein [Bacillus atrophaeus]MEC5219435.1 dimethylarginine dimethylaminohydrolase family protein [Bacillus atrophaeus]MED4581096.1 dimethylarginine dimethylaminohydrolase family protein [Bacillus atrophaeus]MED4720232.1 dimethylarginine dimethylaminohydrolase family pro